MNKNAYEIRLEVLRMAHSDLFSRYHEKMASIRAVDKNNEARNLEMSDSLYPTLKDITQRAQELYAFVENK